MRRNGRSDWFPAFHVIQSVRTLILLAGITKREMLTTSGAVVLSLFFGCSGVHSAKLNIITLTNVNASGLATEPIMSTFHVAIRHNRQRYPELYRNYSVTDLYWPGNMAICQAASNDWVPIKMAEWYSQGVFEKEGATVVLTSVCGPAFPIIGDYLRELDLPVIQCVTSVPVRVDRYPTAVILSATSYTFFGRVVGDLVSFFNWDYVVVLRDQFKKANALIASSRSLTQCDGVLQDLAKRTDTQHQVVQFDSTEGIPVHDALKTAALYSRIIVCCTLFRPMRELLAAARDLNMTNGDHIFMYLYEAEVPGEPPLGKWKQNDILDEKVFEALDSVLVFRTPETDWPSFMSRSEEINRYREGKFGTPYNAVQLYNDFFVSCTSAVDLMSQALDEIWTEDTNTTAKSESTRIVSRRITDKMVDRFHNLPFENIFVTKSGERILVVIVQQYNRTTDKFVNVYTYNIAAAMFDLIDSQRPIHWKLGSVPLDRVGSNSSSSSVLSISVSVTITAIALIVAVVAGILRKQQRQEQYRRTSWMISEEDFVPFLVKSAVSENLADKQIHSPKEATISHGHVVQLRGYPAWKQHLYWPSKGHPNINNNFLKVIYTMDKVSSPNVNKFLGICISTKIPSAFYAVCQRGSVEDMITQHSSDWTLRLFFIRDIIQGLTVLHKSSLRRHGNLKSTKCLLDSRMVIKLTDYCHEDVSRLLNAQSIISVLPQKSESFFAPHCWMAPEVLRGTSATPESDIFAFALISHQIMLHCTVYGCEYGRSNKVTSDAAMEAVSAGSKPHFRPKFPENPANEKMAKLITLLQLCWAEEPMRRPHIVDVATKFTTATIGEGLERTFLDRVIQWLDRHSQILERDVAERTALLLNEQNKADELLCQMLPQDVVKQLRNGQAVGVEYVEEVSILFSDISGFNEFVAAVSPSAILSSLDEIYSMFDHVSTGLSVYKLETIGSSYVAVSGLLENIGQRHADQICHLATLLLRAFKGVRRFALMELLIGIHSGPVAAGVIGLKRPRYCVFGDSMNTASRLQTTCQPSQIHVSPDTVLIAQHFGCQFVIRGTVHLKGKGNITTYQLMHIQE